MNSSLVPNRTLVDLGSGAQVAMFGFRSCAFGRTKCCCLLSMFKDFFGDESGGRILGRFMRLAECLGNNGLRQLDLTVPNAISFTHDEASILSALSAMQHGASAQSRAHLTWLLARSPRSEEMNVISDITHAFSSRDLVIDSPEFQSALSRPRTGEAPQLALVQNV